MSQSIPSQESAIQTTVTTTIQEITPPQVSDALLQAIDTVDASRLRTVIKCLCYIDPLLVKNLEFQFLISEQDVVRYHADTDSEDAGFSGSDEDFEQYEARHKEEEAVKNARPISIEKTKLTQRFVECQNCGEEFNVGKNERGDCVWHPSKSHAPVNCCMSNALFRTVLR